MIKGIKGGTLVTSGLIKMTVVILYSCVGKLEILE